MYSKYIYYKMKTRSGKTYAMCDSNPRIKMETLTLDPQTTQTPDAPEYVNNTDAGVYEVNIDFDDAIYEWLRNKRKLRNCMYEYKCMFVSSSGRECTGKSMPNRNCCWCHRKFDKSHI